MSLLTAKANIRSFNSMTIHLQMVRDCLTVLSESSDYFQIRIACFPGHSDITGNCTADELTRAGTKVLQVKLPSPDSPIWMIFDILEEFTVMPDRGNFPFLWEFLAKI